MKLEKEYPKTYKECFNVCFGNKHHIIQVVGLDGDNKELFESFIKLKICRDAYWKIYGEQMGLDGPWEPDWDNLSANHEFIKINKGCFTYSSRVLVFPTTEMRDTFKKHFDSDIEFCKELL